jgi:hypothetical protein
MRLSCCVVTMDRARITEFLRHHEPLLSEPRLVWHIFCEEQDRTVIESRWPEVDVVCDPVLKGVTPKRNALLAQVRTERVWFLDDDSLIEDVRDFSDWLARNESIPEWCLLSTRYNTGGSGSDPITQPTPMRFMTLGSAIEWNQIMETAAVRTLGGWDERFGPGSHWGAGEGAILMMHLASRGLRQKPVADVIVTHPSQRPGAGFSELAKFRRYRKAQGALLVVMWTTLGTGSTMRWFCRFALFPIPGSAVALLRRDYAIAWLRICSPWDVTTGALECWKARLRPHD